MFGLTFEKLLLIGVIAVFVLGPERLPGYTQKLAQFIRNLRNMANGAKERMRDEMGPDFDDVDWKKLDPRQYDPRRIIREALLDDDPPEPAVRPVSRSTTRPEPAYLQHKAKSAGGPVPVTEAGAAGEAGTAAAGGTVAGGAAAGGAAAVAGGAAAVGAGGAALVGITGAASGPAGSGADGGASPTGLDGADAGLSTFDDTPFPGEVPAAVYDSEAT